jgi:hypothetical protein
MNSAIGLTGSTTAKEKGWAEGLRTSEGFTFILVVLHDLALQGFQAKAGLMHPRLKWWRSVDVSYATPQVHGNVNATLHREYSPVIVFNPKGSSNFTLLQ